MHEHGDGCADDSGSGGQCAEGDGPPGFSDDDAHQEAAEEELFDDRDDEREAEEADGQECVGPGGRSGQFVEWVEGGAVAEAEEFLEAEWGEELALELELAESNPEDDADDADGNR